MRTHSQVFIKRDFVISRGQSQLNGQVDLLSMQRSIFVCVHCFFFFNAFQSLTVKLIFFFYNNDMLLVACHFLYPCREITCN